MSASQDDGVSTPVIGYTPDAYSLIYFLGALAPRRLAFTAKTARGA
jgi:hypothetical protein